MTEEASFIDRFGKNRPGWRRAAALLWRQLSPEQRREALAQGWITVTGSAGGVYTLGLQSTFKPVQQPVDAGEHRSFCIQPVKVLPQPDTALTLLLWLQHQEPFFLSRARWQYVAGPGRRPRRRPAGTRPKPLGMTQEEQYFVEMFGDFSRSPVRAVRLLYRHLTPAQRAEAIQRRRITLRTAGGRDYQIHLYTSSYNVRREGIWRYCVQSKWNVPWADTILTQLLWLQHRERDFLAVACRQAY